MTKKHEAHSSWKRVAMVMFDCDMAEYYAWFIKRRYNLILQSPQRGAHITFINDRAGDMNDKWNEVRDKWDGKEVSVGIDTDVRTDAAYWWLKVAPNETLDGIRSELGLGAPYFSFHLTIGYPNNKNEAHSEYIYKLLKKGLAS